MSVRPRLAAACLSVVLPVALTVGLAPVAHAAETYERVLNGTFDTGKAPWWSSAASPSTVVDGRLCADVPAGTTSPSAAMIGQNDIPLEAGQPYTLRFTATATANVTIRAALGLGVPPYTTMVNKPAAVTATPQAFEFTGTSSLSTIRGQVGFQLGGSAQAFTFCVDDVSLTGGVLPPGNPTDVGSPVRVNQVGYAVHGPKRASIVDPATTPLTWQLRDAEGAVARTGQTRVQGDDAMSGDHVHIADFSDVRTEGTGYTLAVGTAVSEPFDISRNPYDGLRRDALHHFYYMRSGIPIDAALAGPAYARPAGHVGVAPNKGDTAVACLPGTCDYTLDVSGGWYDAGDQGKYVVNGGLAVWQLMDSYERSALTGDRTGTSDDLVAVPESHNRVPDVLDEARWELEFLLKMQVPAGEPLAGMAHHKIHDLAWTALPTLPQNDAQPRYLHPPSTAATLNLAAVGAQCARVWAPYDRAFADRCLTAARTAWQAAKANPAVYAPRSDSVGGGAYDDTSVTDEFSWAAAELFATTGDPRYLPSITSTLTTDGFSWKDTAGLTDLTIARLPLRFPPPMLLAARKRILQVADSYVANTRTQGYPNSFRPDDGVYPWGSASGTANNAMIMVTAWDLSRRPEYRDAALESMDYLLGRNGLNQSYVTGYGERASHNQHSRMWAHQIDPALPNPPAGSLAGGPNSNLQDPIAQQNLRGCAPAKCYIDDIYSYSTNETAINWNSALAWISSYAATASSS